MATDATTGPANVGGGQRNAGGSTPSVTRAVDLTDDGATLELLETSAETAALDAALADAQGEMADPPKNKTAKVRTRAGDEYSYKYADLADLLKIVRPVFKKHGLALVQVPTNPFSGSVKIVTRLSHKSGQWMRGVLTMPVGDDKPQTLGSAITYGRRYSAAGFAGIAPDEDEDGNVAQDAAADKGRGRQGAAAKPKAAPATPAAATPAAAPANDKAHPAAVAHAVAAANAGGRSKAKVAFDIKNQKHCDWLNGELDKLKVMDPTHRDAIGEAMVGKFSEDIPGVVDVILNPPQDGPA